MVIQPLALFHLRQSTPCCTPSVPKYTSWSAAVRLLCIPSKYVTAGWHIPNLYHTLGVPGVLNEDSLCEPFYHENEAFLIWFSTIFNHSATCQFAIPPINRKHQIIYFKAWFPIGTIFWKKYAQIWTAEWCEGTFLCLFMILEQFLGTGSPYG